MYALLLMMSIFIARIRGKVHNALTQHAYLIALSMCFVGFLANEEYNYLPIWYLSEEYFRFFMLFFSGVCYFEYRHKINLSPTLFYSFSALLVLSTLHDTAFFIAYYLFLPYIILYLAYIPKGKILLFNKLGDYSYGIYVYAFPIQQAAVALIPSISVSSMVVLCFPATLLMAVLSWHVIEKRSLKLKGKFSSRRASAQAA